MINKTDDESISIIVDMIEISTHEKTPVHPAYKQFR